MAEIFYCQLADVIEQGVSEGKIIKLTDGDGAVDMDIFNGCRRAAASEVDGYAMVKYSDRIPFQPVPPAIVTIAAILTKYYLYQRKNSVDESLEKLYQQQVDKLKRLAAGTFKIAQDNVEVKSDGVNFTNKTPTDRAFHPDNIAGYIQ
jgi:phage gp36-like protein